MELYKDEFIEITFDETKKIIINNWFKNTKNMKHEQYKTIMLKFAELAKINKPLFHLIKSVDFLYTITIDMQEWTNNNIFPTLVAAGIKKIAFLVSSEIVAQLSIEQALDESNAKFQVKYFDLEKNAISWLSE